MSKQGLCCSSVPSKSSLPFCGRGVSGGPHTANILKFEGEGKIIKVTHLRQQLIGVAI